MEKKFKAWLIKEKKMVIPDTIPWNKGYGGTMQIHVDNPEFDPVKHILHRDKYDKIVPFFTYDNFSCLADSNRNKKEDEFVLLQYTGLNDKNGNEIYEGDIIQYLGYEVCNGMQVRPKRIVIIDDLIKDSHKLICISEGGNNTIEIIGSKFENPELLNKS